MKALILIAGIALLIAGTWFQDIWIVSEVIEAPCRVTHGGFSRAYINDEIVRPLQKYVELGKGLKLGAFALLLSLLFNQIHKTGLNAKWTTIAGICTALCLASFAVYAPASETVLRAIQLHTIEIDPGLDSNAFRENLRERFSSSTPAATGALTGSIGFFLLGAILPISQRKTLPAWFASAVIAPLYSFTQPERRVAEFFDPVEYYIPWGVFTVSAFIFIVGTIVVSIWGLVARKRNPNRVRWLTMLCLFSISLLLLIFWLSILAAGCQLAQTASLYDNDPTVADLAGPVYWFSVQAFWLSVSLLLSAIFLPLLCMLTLKHPQRKEVMPSPKSS